MRLVNRSRHRAPNLCASDRILAGVCALFMRPARVIRSATHAPFRRETSRRNRPGNVRFLRSTHGKHEAIALMASGRRDQPRSWSSIGLCAPASTAGCFHPRAVAPAPKDRPKHWSMPQLRRHEAAQPRSVGLSADQNHHRVTNRSRSPLRSTSTRTWCAECSLRTGIDRPPTAGGPSWLTFLGHAKDCSCARPG